MNQMNDDLPPQEAQPQEAQPQATPDQQTWHFRGQNFSTSEFNTAMVHLYRGEVTRSNTWRNRLDTTTNWAVVTTAALLTFTFGQAVNNHVVLLLGLALNTIFLVIEARRYRYYELWALRVRLMETDFFAAMLAPPFAPGKDWARHLSESLLVPQFPISLWEAIGRRLRRNFLGIFLLILVSWIIKLIIHPQAITSYTQFVTRAAIGPIPGQAIILALTIGYSLLLSMAIFTASLQNSPGEILPRYPSLNLSGGKWSKLWPLKQTKHLVIIITSHGQTISDEILTRLKRGVTALQGKGMYTGEEKMVLLSGVFASEIANLKALVYSIDPEAFIVVNATEDIIGSRFNHLSPAWRQRSDRK